MLHIIIFYYHYRNSDLTNKDSQEGIVRGVHKTVQIVLTFPIAVNKITRTICTLQCQMHQDNQCSWLINAFSL